MFPCPFCHLLLKSSKSSASVAGEWHEHARGMAERASVASQEVACMSPSLEGFSQRGMGLLSLPVQESRAVFSDQQEREVRARVMGAGKGKKLDR